MGKDLFVCLIYVDDIIFGSTNKSFCDEFSKIMTNRFEMYVMRVLTFFLDFKSSKPKRGLSLAKQSTHMIYSRSLAWTISIWEAHWLIKMYIAP
jgi:hypothetical protein